ncbi:MAG: conjugal transfer protein TraN [Bacteroidetes bacterium HGW-Bacteroidetes-3]|nr:MAG: conjugal transfer protein TraN [Bacteroidetes bacterium HGW-Bacteroidetes-3]
MKTTFTFIICTFSIILHAQNIEKLDTIYANDTKTVSLFFPKPIRQGIVGKSHFVFSYNKEIAQYFGLLQATPGVKSNLLAITTNGQVYSYILKYADTLQKLNYFISEQESIGNEKPSSNFLSTGEKTPSAIDTLISDQFMVYKETCSELLVNSKKKIIRSKRKNQIRLSVKNSAYKNNALYFSIEIENKSTIDYDVNFLRFFISNSDGLKKKSSQTISKNPLFTYLQPRKIKAKTKSEFMVVFSKFTIDNHKKMIVELNEANGERNIKLKIAGGQCH